MSHAQPSAYVETSILSYLAARKSRDARVAENQRITAEWWRTAKERYELHISALVLEEAERGDPERVKERLKFAHGLNKLEALEDSLALTAKLMDKLLPHKALADATHISIATVHEMDYLLTWNCKHLANEFLRKSVQRICSQNGYKAALICTPRELYQGL